MPKERPIFPTPWLPQIRNSSDLSPFFGLFQTDLIKGPNHQRLCCTKFDHLNAEKTPRPLNIFLYRSAQVQDQEDKILYNAPLSPHPMALLRRLRDGETSKDFSNKFFNSNEYGTPGAKQYPLSAHSGCRVGALGSWRHSC